MYQNAHYQQVVERARQLAAAQATPTPAPSPAAPAPTPAAAPLPAAAPTPKPEPAVAEKTQVVPTALADYTFTNLGGGIKTVALTQYQGDAPGQQVVLNESGSHPIGALMEQPLSGGTEAAAGGEGPGASDQPYTVAVNGKEVVCERDTPQGVHIKKTFTLPDRSDATKLNQRASDYTVQMTVEFSNAGAPPVRFGSATDGTNAAYFVSAGSAAPFRAKEFPSDTTLGWFRNEKAEFVDVGWFDEHKVPLVGIQTSPAHSVYEQSPGDVIWVGVKNQYFSTILSADPLAKGVWASRFPVTLEGKEFHGIQGMLQLPGVSLEPGKSNVQNFTLFAGPNQYRLLSQLDHGQSAMMKVRFRWISLALLGLLNWLHDLLPFHNFAIAIILLTFIVRGALWPLQGAATKSMKRMQVLAPKQAELREKYKDDPAKMNTEMIKLFKDYKVNPLAGCLPMLIQIPIFFAFYSMLGCTVELRNAQFLWVHDLSRPDTVFEVMGFPVNILPILMAITMIWQMAISPKSGDPAQQKMMMLMPLMFVFFCYNFASALALYYTVVNILSIIQLYLTRNQVAPVVESAKAAGKKSGGRKPGQYR